MSKSPVKPKALKNKITKVSAEPEKSSLNNENKNIMN